MPNYTLSLGLLLVPLVLFVVLALWGKLLFAKTAGYMAVIGTLITTAIALFIAYNFFYNNPTVQGTYSAITVFSYPWLVFTKDLAITIGIELDALSVMMIVVVNIVSLMVHLYSLWYMKGEERYVRFFAYLSLFCFSMVGLVLSGNIFQIYIFWELVGVSSFLLIGFYFQKPSAVAAAKKAFIVTRFADFIFLVGILVLGWQLQSFDVQLLITKAQALHQAGVLA
ncbi:MAG: proton-conducting transporter membrane subunit, partial [Chitinophagaceae bacterium]